MLFIDDDCVYLTDLLAVDPEIGDVSDAEGITVNGEGGIIRQAWEECADKLTQFLQSFSGSGVRCRARQIVVSAEEGRKSSPLKRWMIYRALVLFYRAAANRRESDRYDRKRNQFEVDEKRAWKVLCAAGVPAVGTSLPCPGAWHEDGVGDWTQHNVSVQPGMGTEAGGVFRAVITWTNGKVESGPSSVVAVEVPAGCVAQFGIDGLTPPTGGNTLAATGWNIYMGGADGRLYRQNASPIPVVMRTFTMESDPVLSDVRLGNGQVAEHIVALQNTVWRA